MTFGAKTSGSDDLKAIISAISTLVEEATFVATAEGITFRGMDPSHDEARVVHEDVDRELGS